MHKLGRYVLVTESDVSRAERFLEGRGMWAIPVGRMLPFVRAFTSIVAGLVRVPAGKFGILSLIGTVLYAAALSSIGYALGSTWQSVSHGLAVVGYVLFALVVLAIVGFVAYRWRAVPARGPAQARVCRGCPGRKHRSGAGLALAPVLVPAPVLAPAPALARRQPGPGTGQPTPPAPPAPLAPVLTPWHLRRPSAGDRPRPLRTGPVAGAR